MNNQEHFTIVVWYEVREYEITPNSAEYKTASTSTSISLPCETITQHKSLIVACDRFIQIKDTLPREGYPYLDNFTIYTDWDTEEGSITLTWSDTLNAFAIYAVAVRPSLQKTGIFTRLIQYVTSHADVSNLYVLAVENPYLTAFLGRFQINGKGFCRSGEDWIWRK